MRNIGKFDVNVVCKLYDTKCRVYGIQYRFFLYVKKWQTEKSLYMVHIVLYIHYLHIERNGTLISFQYIYIKHITNFSWSEIIMAYAIVFLQWSRLITVQPYHNSLIVQIMNIKRCHVSRICIVNKHFKFYWNQAVGCTNKNMIQTSNHV